MWLAGSSLLSIFTYIPYIKNMVLDDVINGCLCFIWTCQSELVVPKK